MVKNLAYTSRSRSSSCYLRGTSRKRSLSASSWLSPAAAPCRPRPLAVGSSPAGSTAMRLSFHGLARPLALLRLRFSS